MKPNEVSRSLGPALLFGLLSVTNTSSLADEPLGWDDFDVGKAQAVLREYTVGDLSVAESVFEWENRILDAERRNEDEQVLKRLRRRQHQWRELAAEMERALADETRRARRDAGVRRAVQALKIVAFIAEEAHELHGDLEKTVGNGKENPAAKEGDFRIRDERRVERFEDGEWRLLDLRRSWTQGSLPPELMDPAVRTMRRQLGEWIQDVPTLLCNPEFGGCIETPPGFAERPRAPLAAEIPAAASKDQIDIFRLASELALELTPLPDLHRLATGTDPWTGESTSRAAAAGWLVVGSIGLKPLAKVVRVGGKRMLRYAGRNLWFGRGAELVETEVEQGIYKGYSTWWIQSVVKDTKGRPIWVLGEHKSPEKWHRQLAERGWDAEAFNKTLDTPYAKMNTAYADQYGHGLERATRYVRDSSGASVTVTDRSRRVVQISHKKMRRDKQDLARYFMDNPGEKPKFDKLKPSQRQRFLNSLRDQGIISGDPVSYLRP